MKFNFVLFCLGIFLSGCKSEMDDLIKQGSFDACPDHTVETLVSNYFDNPKWESFISPDDDKYHLNVSGTILYNDKPTKILLQFEFTKGEHWQINAMDFNGEPQSEEMIYELVNSMCEESSK